MEITEVSRTSTRYSQEEQIKGNKHIHVACIFSVSHVSFYDVNGSLGTRARPM